MTQGGKECAKKIRIASAAKNAIKITNFEYSELFFIYIFDKLILYLN
jgi:hypothetical protein